MRSISILAATTRQPVLIRSIPTQLAPGIRPPVRVALYRNTTGIDNTAHGANALYRNTTGKNNIAVGVSAGFDLATGNNNIYIGNTGNNGEYNKIRIGT